MASLRLPGGAFRFRPWSTLLTVLALPLLLALGNWQLDRAERRHQALLGLEAAASAAPLPLGALGEGEATEHRLLRLDGWFDASHSVLLSPRRRQERPGAELLQPFFDIPSGRWVLVNRGWLPWAAAQPPPELATPAGRVQISVRIHHAREPDLPLSKPFEAGHPLVLHYLAPTRLWALLERDGVGYRVRQADGPGQLDIRWPATGLSPAQHRLYAVQWFAMAAAIAGLWLFLGLQTGAPPAAAARNPLSECRR